MKYKLEIWSRGLDVGIGTISKEQYEYWADDDNAMYLTDALQDSYDYEENDTPDECKFVGYYNDYDDVLSTFGADLEMASMTIKDEEGNIVYMGEVSDFAYEHDPEYEIPIIESAERDYFISLLDKGYYVKWVQGGKGLYTDGEFEADSFDPKKLKFNIKETDNGDVIDSVYYNDQEIEKGGEYDIKSFEAEVYQV